MICLNKTEIKVEYYIMVSIPETMELLGSTKSKINKYKNDENVPYLKFTAVLLIH